MIVSWFGALGWGREGWGIANWIFPGFQKNLGDAGHWFLA